MGHSAALPISSSHSASNCPAPGTFRTGIGTATRRVEVGVEVRIWRLAVLSGLRGRLPRLLHRLFEAFGVQTRIIERITTTPVRQGQFSGHPNVLFGHRGGTAPGGMGDGGARHHQIGAHSVDVERRAQRGDTP